MTVTIKKQYLYEFLLIVLILFNEHCFYIFNNYGYWIEVTLVFAIVFFFLQPRFKERFIENIVGKFLLLGAVSMGYTVVFSMQSVVKAGAAYIYFLIPVVGIPIAQNENFSKRVIKNAIEKVSFGMSLIYLIQYFLGNKVQIFNAFIYTADSSVRIIIGSIIIGIGFLMMFAESLEDIRNTKLIVKTMVVGFVIIKIIRSRSIIFAVLISMFYIVLKSFRYIENPESIKLWRVMEAGAVIFVGIIAYKIVSDIITESFLINESSSVLRLGGYKYYFNLFLKHPFLGIGRIRNQAVDGLAQWGIRNRYYIDDIGIVGYLAQFGLAGIIFLGEWLTKTLRWLRKHENGIGENAIFLFVILLLPFSTLFNIDTAVLYMILIPILYCKS